MATRSSDIPIASLGYDRIRFVGPAFPGETIEAQFVVVAQEEAKRRIIADIEVRCGGRIVAVARNILRTLD
jgi:acyl dehydratase